jgi:hypothetical protein
LSKNYRMIIVLVLSLLLAIPVRIVSSQHPGVFQDQIEYYFPIIQQNFGFPTPTPTRIPRPTSTRTSTSTLVPFRSSTPIPTATQTPSATITPTVTLTPTYTSTTTLIPLASITIQFPSLTPSLTSSPTASQTSMPSPIPYPGVTSRVPPAGWLVIILVGLLWTTLAIWLYLFLRQRNRG